MKIRSILVAMATTVGLLLAGCGGGGGGSTPLPPPPGGQVFAYAQVSLPGYTVMEFFSDGSTAPTQDTIANLAAAAAAKSLPFTLEIHDSTGTFATIVASNPNTSVQYGSLQITSALTSLPAIYTVSFSKNVANSGLNELDLFDSTGKNIDFETTSKDGLNNIIYEGLFIAYSKNFPKEEGEAIKILLSQLETKS